MTSYEDIERRNAKKKVNRLLKSFDNYSTSVKKDGPVLAHADPELWDLTLAEFVQLAEFAEVELGIVDRSTVDSLRN